MLRGILAAGTAFTMWGVFPVFLRLMQQVPPLEILSHRVLWSTVLLLSLLGLRRQWGWVEAIRHAAENCTGLCRQRRDAVHELGGVHLGRQR